MPAGRITVLGATRHFHHGLLGAAARAAGATAPNAASLRGVVTDPDGRPVPGVQIILSTPVAFVTTAVSDAEGRYRFDRMQPGAYELRASLPGFGADPIPISLGDAEDRNVDISLRLSARSESVIVTGSQTDLLSRAPDSVTVLTARDLAVRQIETAADALRLVPGLTVTQNGGRGGLTAVFPRGAESDSTLVLIDGMRANAFGGGYDFAHLSLADIERIEIVRGPQSALYGSDAIGAVVQIVTRHGGPARADVVLEHGTFDTTAASVGAAGSIGSAWSWGAGADGLTTDGFTGTAPASGERVSNDDYRRHAVSLSGGWLHPTGHTTRGGDPGRNGAEASIRADIHLERNERGLPGPFGSNPIGVFSGVDRISRETNETALFSAGATHRWSRAARHRLQVTAADLDSAFLSPFGESQAETRRFSVRSQTDLVISPRAGASMGIELQRERARSTFVTGSAATPVPINRLVVGYFGEGRMDVANRVFLTAGLRVEQIRRNALERDAGQFGVRPAFGSDTVLSANPKVSLAWFLEPADRRSAGWTRLRANVGTGIRPPDALELAFTDNPELKPERSRSADVGVERAFMSGALILEATGFASRFDDLIVAVGQSFQNASQFQTDNISNARARGLELQAAVRAEWGLEARATYTWMDTEILAVDRSNGQAPPPFTVGDPLLRRPRHQGMIDLALDRERFSAYARFGGRGRAVDVEPSFGAFGGVFDVPGYAVAGIGASVRITRLLDVTLRCQNLFDRAFEEALGFPALGRSATVGIRIAARR